MRPLDLRKFRFQGQPGQPEISLEWQCDHRNVHMFHGMKLFGPDAEMTDDGLRQLFLRLFCHLLVDQIPDEGLAETCESLGEFYEYYKPAPMVTHQLEVRERPAIKGTCVERPAFAFDEE
jgi:hypothetical protein